MTIAQLKNRFQYIQEWHDDFLALFPHRFDYIWAEHPNPGAKVEWKTESRHPLSDRLIQQNAYLYGIRFGAETHYSLIDIDIHSLYHPQQDPFAISRIITALEPIGLISPLICTSSHSGGLHLYFPFQQAQSSWQLAIVLACLLENAGFKILPGQLEIFPNPKPYSTDGNLSLFNAHRLPLQQGSYLLDETFQPIWSNTQTFVQQWQLCQQRNDIDRKTLKQILKQAKRKHFGISGKAEKFVNDLNTEIETGWTGKGQTNRLLGRITMRAYIFHHILSGGEPLEGGALVDEIVETARSLPGYQDWCSHQHEIKHRAEEWARCVENSHYFHFGDQDRKPKSANQDPELTAAIEQTPSWNQRQSEATRDRIRRAIANLLETSSLPTKPTARFQSLLKYGIGGASLYRHRDLWHPNYLNIDLNQNLEDESEQYTNNLPDCQSCKTDRQVDHTGATDNWHITPSLLPTDAGDNPLDAAFDDRTPFNPLSDDGNSADRSSNPRELAELYYIQQVLSTMKAAQDAFQEATRIAQSHPQRSKNEAVGQRQIKRMQRFLDSGDPILVAEALAWGRIYPGLLDLSQIQLPLFVEMEE